MSRRVVIGILIFLLLILLAGIAALFILSSATPETPQITSTPSPSATPVEDPTADSDNDGLSNGDERTWGSSPSNADTDGDGFKDGIEVATNHNPTIASPNDKLPAGFQPQQNTSPLQTSAPSGRSFDSFFSNSVDLTGGNKNLSQEYARVVPDAEKSPATLSQFITSQPIITSLPAVNDAAITVREESSPIFISEYLNIAGSMDAIADKARMTIALNDFFKDKSAYGFITLGESVKSFQSRIKTLSVPPEAVQYQKLILGYTELLAATLQQIGNYQNDQLKAMVALRQLDAIDRLYYPVILQERARLSSLAQ